MKEHIQKTAAILAALIISLALLGCGKSNDGLLRISDTPITLWVVTEETAAGGMNDQARMLAEQFEADHSNVTVQLDILPNEEEARAEYLTQLYEKMDAGCGPDVFLLPTNSVLALDHPQQYTYAGIDMLFPNVDRAMRSNRFFDLSAYYDADRDLGKEALEARVMDAGLVGSKRYVLPLRFNIPVFYAYPDELEALGVYQSALDQGIEAWMDTVLKTGDPLLVCSADYPFVSAFSDLIDYDAGTVTLKTEDVEQYLRRYQQVMALAGSEDSHRNNGSLKLQLGRSWKHFPVHTNNLDAALGYAATAKASGQDLSMHAVKTTDGKLIASIRYYGAISTSCANPSAAYAFLRQFLLEDTQWEQSRTGDQYPGLLEMSWPVRTKGSVEPLWAALKRQTFENDPGAVDMGLNGRLAQAVKQVELTQDDIPVLNTPIDEARFPLETNPFAICIPSLNDASNGNAPLDADFPALAEALIQHLQTELSK